MNKSTWFHSIQLGKRVMRGRKSYEDLCHSPILGMTPSVKDKSVLDIGCAEGFFSFWAEEQGAKTVRAVDISHDMIAKAIWAKDERGSDVQFIQGDFLDIPLNSYDHIFLLGVLYHMKSPWLAIERAASLLNSPGIFIVESHIFTEIQGFPMMRFWPGNELNNDLSNWFSPNPECVQAMLNEAGLILEEERIFNGVEANTDRGIWRAMKP